MHEKIWRRCLEEPEGDEVIFAFGGYKGEWKMVNDLMINTYYKI